MSDTYEAAVEIREAIFDRLPDWKERRKYALLSAAATIQAGLAIRGVNQEESVLIAVTLLAAIEKREAQP